MATKGSYEDFFAAVRMRESGGNYEAQNQWGARGAYQFHEIPLLEIGWYNADGTYDRPDDWRGTFAAKSGVTNIQEFMASPASQDAAFAEWAKVLWSYASSDPFRTTEHVGKTINGTLITATGIIGGGHLWGPEVIDQYLDSNGAIDPKDPFGTPISEYVRLFSGYESPFDTGRSTPATPTTTDTITVRVNGDDYNGDANFVLTLDGRTIDPTNLVTANQNMGEWQTFTFTGDFDLDGLQNHRVGIKFDNDAWGGPAAPHLDRNLYVDSVTFNGTVNNADAAYYTNGERYWDFAI
jgi:hypothetical protein